MTNEELQELIDAIDLSVGYVPPEYERALKRVSNLLVDLPDETVESLELRQFPSPSQLDKSAGGTPEEERTKR